MAPRSSRFSPRTLQPIIGARGGRQLDESVAGASGDAGAQPVAVSASVMRPHTAQDAGGTRGTRRRLPTHYGRSDVALLNTPVRGSGRRGRRPLDAGLPTSPAVEVPASPGALSPLRIPAPLAPRPATSGNDGRRRSSLARLEFMCSICHDVMTAPVITRCGHRFDHHCLARWMCQSRGGSVQLGGGCPLCKAQLGSEPPEVNEKLRLMIYAALPDAMSRAQKHRPLAVMYGHRSRLRCMLLSSLRPTVAAAAAALDADAPPNLTLYTGGEDGDIRVWSIPDGKCTAVLEGHTSWVNCLELTEDGSILVSGAGDSTARVWDVTPGQRPRCRHVLEGHEGWILSLAIYGTLLATAGKDTHVRVWDVRSGECLAVLQDAAAKGNLAVGIVPPEYVGVQTLLARPVKEPGPIEGTSWTLCFDADGDSFFTKTDGSDGHSWDPPAEVLAVEAREIAAKKAQTQKDEETTGIVYCGGLGKKVQLWECPVPNKSASSSAAAAIFASRGPVGYSGMLEVDPLRSLGQSRFCVSHALWKEGYGYDGGAVLATGFVDGAIRLFGLGPDCATPMRDSSETRTPMTVEAVKGGAEPDAPLVQLFGHTASVQCMSWLVQKDGTRLLVSGGREGEVRLWDPIPSGRGCIAVLKGHIGGVNCIAVCDITGLIVTGGDDSTVRVWDGATSMACVATLRGHTSYIVSVMVMGKLVVSASSDGTSRAWWLIMGAEQVTPRMSG